MSVPAPFSVGRPRTAARKIAFADFALLAFYIAAVGAFVLYNSRILTLYMPTPSTALIGVAAMCLGWALLPMQGRMVSPEMLLVPLILGVLVILWSDQYHANTSFDANYKKLSSYSAIFAVFPIYCCYGTFGPARTLKVFYFIAVIYCVLYALLSISLLQSGGSNFEQGSMVVHDIRRGYRLYLCFSLLAFAYFYQIFALLHGSARVGLARYAGNFCLLAISVFDLYISQYRFALGCTVLGTLLIFMPAVARKWAGPAVIGTLVVVLLVALGSAYEISTVLAAYPSMSIRLKTIVNAVDFFDRYPVLGLGLPGDIADYRRIMGYAYDPSDLGIVGIAAEGGIVGVASFLYVLAVLVRGQWSAARLQRDIPLRAFGVACLCTVFYGAISPAAINGDGLIVVAFALALTIYVARSGRAAASRRRHVVAG